MKLTRTILKEEEVELPLYYKMNNNYYMICESKNKSSPIGILHCDGKNIEFRYYSVFILSDFSRDKIEIDETTFLNNYLETENFLKRYLIISVGNKK